MKETTFNKYFVSAKRNNGKEFVKLVNGVPTYLYELCRKIHKELGTCLPDDWIYGRIWEAFYAIEVDYSHLEFEERVDAILQDFQGDIYNNDLLEWLKTGWSLSMYEEAVKEFGHSQEGLPNTIQVTQWYCYDRILRMVQDFVLFESTTESLLGEK